MIANTLDGVIDCLEQIIQDSIRDESCHGYFAALYQKVTIAVKDNLHKNYFDDDARMEQLDIVFANRYLQAYTDYKAGNPVTASWLKAFDSVDNNNIIVLQHLLLGMNAHINLDLGIAAAQISTNKTISFLHSDFNKINNLLGSLVDEVQADLAKIWPKLHMILKLVKNVDNLLVDFGMGLARDGAWKFANELSVISVATEIDSSIAKRDMKISKISRLITEHKLPVRIIFKIIKLGERGKVSDKIRALEKVIDLKPRN